MIPDPAEIPVQAVLETTLRGYSCLTVGDAICVHYNNKKYFIDVIEARPANAIGVIDTDCQVSNSRFVSNSRHRQTLLTP